VIIDNNKSQAAALQTECGRYVLEHLSSQERSGSEAGLEAGNIRSGPPSPCVEPYCYAIYYEPTLGVTVHGSQMPIPIWPRHNSGSISLLLLVE
jgi:hypothetical protein